MRDRTLYPLLEHAVRTWPGAVAQVRGRRRLTFLQLKTAAEQLAAELKRARVEPGHKIGLLCPNGPEYVIGSFALLLIDALVVPIFPGLKQAEIAALDADLRLDGFCYNPELESALSKVQQSEARRLDLHEPSISFCLQKIERESSDPGSIDRLTGEGAPLIVADTESTRETKG